jgi:hypothetical protein
MKVLVLIQMLLVLFACYADEVARPEVTRQPAAQAGATAPTPR